MRKRVVLLLVMLFSMLIVTLLHAQTDRALYFDVQREPTIRHGDSGTWDGRYTDPGAVAFHDGTFYMFRNGFAGWPAVVDIALHTSDDGLNWIPVGDEPIIRTADAPGDALAVLASSAFVEDDGTWVLYFYTYPDANTGVNGSILRATADTPDGAWTFDAEPVLTPGGDDSWDSLRVAAPSVVKNEGGYVMFYEGMQHPIDGIRVVGMATSADGITWTKYDDPATTDAPYAESDPVFTEANVPWDADGAHQPRVRLTPDGMVMLFRTFTGRQQDISFGMALSDDGLTWRTAEEPALIWNDRSVLSQIWYSELEYANGEYFGYFEIGLGSTTNIHASKLVGVLP